MKTYVAKPATVEHKWLHLDADGQILGRMASQIAVILMGKHKPTYTPHVDTGDHVVVTNIEKLATTGTKASTKVYRRHTLYPGGLKEKSFADMMVKNPDLVLKLAVRRMLPKTKLGKAMLKKLHVYAGPDHLHGGQQPETFTL